MERRNFLKFVSVGASVGAVAAVGGRLLGVWDESVQEPVLHEVVLNGAGNVVFEDMSTNTAEMARSIRTMSTPAPDVSRYLREFRSATVAVEAPGTKKYLRKMQNFEYSHEGDVYLAQSKHATLISTFQRLDRVQNLVGHGNFNVVGFDEMLRFSRRYSSIGSFPTAELDFLEDVFSDNVHRYGFLGEKVITNLTAVIASKDRTKVRQTGHFLFKGESYRLYQQVRADLGESVVLTSGIRSVVKQSHLFLAKTIQADGNLSRASRSLAPPGHSFHGVGDFDVGKVGFGSRNFTAEFARTAEFKKLVDLGYVKMRYPLDNLLGVRYEPWHIKVV